MTRPSTQQAFEHVRELVDKGVPVTKAVKQAGISSPQYYKMRQRQALVPPTFPTYSDEPDNELPRLRKLCQAQTALLASVGLKVEVV